MKTKLSVIVIISFLIPISTFGQRMGFDKINGSKLTPWLSKQAIEYQNVYHFGDSEMESSLIILISSDKAYAQIKSGIMSEDGSSFVWQYRTLTNVKIEGNRFISDLSKGEFVIYDNGKEKIKGLKILTPWSGITEKGEYEFGPKSYPVKDYYSGKYPNASLKLLKPEDLKNLSKPDLKIMRNEIFARYGFVFKSGGEMDTYFKKQDWYSPQHTNVDSFFTDLEKENIKLLQQWENK